MDVVTTLPFWIVALKFTNITDPPDMVPYTTLFFLGNFHWFLSKLFTNQNRFLHEQLECLEPPTLYTSSGFGSGKLQEHLN